MGKNLKGKECGKGICQRKDGKYTARYSAKHGKRREKHFNTLQEAKNWLADIQYAERHALTPIVSDLTVDEWFEYWMDNLICDLAPNTKKKLSGALRIQRAAGDWHNADVRSEAHALQGRSEPYGSNIRGIYDPTDVHRNGNAL